MDDIDRAQELDAQFRNQALRDAGRQRQRGESQMICMACDEAIPAARRRAAPGCTHCITCAALIEQGKL